MVLAFCNGSEEGWRGFGQNHFFGVYQAILIALGFAELCLTRCREWYKSRETQAAGKRALQSRNENHYSGDLRPPAHLSHLQEIARDPFARFR